MEVIIGGSLIGLGYLMKDEPNREYDKNIEITSKVMNWRKSNEL